MKIFNKIMGFLGSILVTTGELGLTIFGLKYLWSVSKIAFVFAVCLIAIITVIDKIKCSEKEDKLNTHSIDRGENK